MYNFPYYKAADPLEVKEFMQQHPFITLIGCDKNNSPVATNVPVLFGERDGKLFLLGHIMKQTDHHLAFLNNPNVLAVFSGPHTYISASWYTNKQRGSTWNYLTVHAKGILKFTNEEKLLNVLERTTAHFENNPDSPSLFKHLPHYYIDRLIKAIVSFEIEVTGLDHVFKLSQNQDEESYQSIIEKLQQGDSNAQQIAELMFNRSNHLFKDETSFS